MAVVTVVAVCLFPRAEPQESFITAACDGNLQGLAAFACSGGDVNARTQFGYTALHIAVLNDRTEAVRSLLRLGADVNARDDDGAAPLHSCANRAVNGGEIPRALIAAGADVNAVDKKGATPLHRFAAA